MRLKLPIAHLLKAQRRWEKTLVKVTSDLAQAHHQAAQDQTQEGQAD